VVDLKFAPRKRTLSCELQIRKPHEDQTLASVLIDSEVRPSFPPPLANFGIGTLVVIDFSDTRNYRARLPITGAVPPP